MAKIIFKCAVNGITGSMPMGRGRVAYAMCGSIKVGDKSICGAHGNYKCKHKVKQSNHDSMINNIIESTGGEI